MTRDSISQVPGRGPSLMPRTHRAAPRHMSPPPLYPYEVETDHLIALTHPGISSPSLHCAKNDLSVEQVGGEFENYTSDEGKSFLHIISILFWRLSFVNVMTFQLTAKFPRTGLHWPDSENPEKPGCPFQRKEEEAISRMAKVGGGSKSRYHLGCSNP